MDLEVVTLSEVSQTDKDKYHMISLILGIQNMTQMNLSMKQTHRLPSYGKTQTKFLASLIHICVCVCVCVCVTESLWCIAEINTTL